MTKHALPLIDPERTEFGFPRTVCDCKECTLYCRYIPGYLIPADLDRIHQYLAPDEDLYAWARRYLLASPGAKVAQRGGIFRIRTLVPARQARGACTLLTVENRCAIHAVAPYGCGFFDSHMTPSEADRRSLRGLHAVLEAWASGNLYPQIWVALDRAGLKAPAPEFCRRQLQQALDQETAS